ncbi:Ribosome biogenesis protein NOP53-like protein [Drosera capensis]
MGKLGKNARKGKKSWRKLSAADIEHFHQQSTKDAISGASLAAASNDSLFVLDKSTDVPLKRKIEKHREKVLRYESVLMKNPLIQVVPSLVTKKKSKKKVKRNVVSQPVASGSKGDEVTELGTFDVWADEGDCNDRRKKVSPFVIPAVEVEAPGCSFNPEPESHKDSLAAAVADEMKKIYRSELGPQPVPLTVEGEAKAIDEEDIYFLEADYDGKDEMDEENGIPDEETLSENRMSTTKMVTRVELNRRARRKERLREEAEMKNISDIIQEIEEEDKEKEKRHIRRVVAKQERLKSCPPRLGKRKFEPARVQVLLSEEITGSLRQLKGCCTLAKDRFKSLEKRGLLEVGGIFAHLDVTMVGSLKNEVEQEMMLYSGQSLKQLILLDDIVYLSHLLGIEIDC